jgi:hypothetical protein
MPVMACPSLASIVPERAARQAPELQAIALTAPALLRPCRHPVAPRHLA